MATTQRVRKQGLRTPQHLKYLIVSDALLIGAPEAAKKWDVSAQTIYNWTDDLGGLTRLQEIYETRTAQALADAKVTISGSIKDQFAHMSERNRTEIFIQLLKTEAQRTTKTTTQPAVEVYTGTNNTLVQQAPDSPSQLAEVARVLLESGALDRALLQAQNAINQDSASLSSSPQEQ